MQKTVHTPDQGMHNLSSYGKKFFHLIEFDSKEELLLEIRKHPFGLAILLAIGGFVAATVFAITVSLAVSGFFDDVGINNAAPILVFIGFVLAVLVMVVTYINAQLYRSNVVYVTNEKIAQVLYITIFHRKISQLNIGDMQDVTVSQKTFFSRIFNYGTLVIETAGEQQNYTFTYVPHPYQSSKKIIAAHEANMQLHGN